MDEKEFQQLVVAGNETTLVEAVSGLSEPERADLLRKATALRKTHASGWAELGPQYSCAVLALLATCSLREALCVCTRGDGVPRELVARVLVDRKPEWVDEWVARKLKKTSLETIEWKTIELLVEGGACKRPENDLYYIAMGRDLKCGYVLMPGEPKENRRSLSDFFRDRVDLHPTLWGLIELPSGGIFYAGSREDPLQVALKELAEEGVLDRGRLFRAVVAPLLNTWTGEHGSASLVDFFDGLAPTPEELVPLQEDFLRLLASEWEPTVDMALKRLRQLSDAGSLDGGAFVKAAGPLFKSARVDVLKRCLALLKDIGSRDQDELPEVLKILLAKALKHPNDGVAGEAVDLLALWDEHLSPAQRKRVAARRDSLP